MSFGFVLVRVRVRVRVRVSEPPEGGLDLVTNRKGALFWAGNSDWNSLDSRPREFPLWEFHFPSYVSTLATTVVFYQQGDTIILLIKLYSSRATFLGRMSVVFVILFCFFERRNCSFVRIEFKIYDVHCRMYRNASFFSGLFLNGGTTSSSTLSARSMPILDYTFMVRKSS